MITFENRPCPLFEIIFGDRHKEVALDIRMGHGHRAALPNLLFKEGDDFL